MDVAEATITLTEPQSSFLQLEIVERFIDDDEKAYREVAWVLLDSLERSKGRRADVWNKRSLREMVLGVINFIDDEIEAAKKGDKRALGRIGGVDTIAEARAIHRSGQAILNKLR